MIKFSYVVLLVGAAIWVAAVLFTFEMAKASRHVVETEKSQVRD